MKVCFNKVLSFMLFFLMSLSIIGNTISVKADSDYHVYIEGQYVASINPAGAVKIVKSSIKFAGKVIDMVSKLVFIKDAVNVVKKAGEGPCALHLVLNSAGLPDFPPGSRFGKIDVINNFDPKNILLEY